LPILDTNFPGALEIQAFKYTILFDDNYIEPALVTTVSILSVDPERRITLVYKTNGSIDDETRILLERFAAYGGGRVEVLLLNTKSLHQFNFRKGHFNDTIIIKILLPHLLPETGALVIIDAGMLPGMQYWTLARYIQRVLDDTLESYTYSARCFHPTQLMSKNLLNLPHSEYYPGGQLIIFNVQRYRETSLGDKIITLYHEHKEFLLLAEQELLCLATDNSDVFPLDADFWLPFLTARNFQLDLKNMREAYSSCSFMKFVGPVKPWHSSCLDPLKGIYLQKRKILEAQIAISNHPGILRARAAVAYPTFLKESLDGYDDFLSSYYLADALALRA
jgi:lipopolysaccharide biosynthesis glycosyltransferase